MFMMIGGVLEGDLHFLSFGVKHPLDLSRVKYKCRNNGVTRCSFPGSVRHIFGLEKILNYLRRISDRTRCMNL